MAILRGKRRYRKYPRKYASSRATRFMSAAGKGIYLASKALSVAQGVRAIINSEKKTFDSTPSDSFVSSTGSMVCLTNVTQGDDYNDRDGRSILLKSVQLYGWAVISASATTTVFRMIVFRDNNDDGTDPTATDLLNANTTYDLRNSDPVAMKRFHIYLDKTYTFDSAKSKIARLDWFKKLSHHVKFDASGNSSAGSLWVYLLSNEPTNTPTVRLRNRIRFYDN